MQFENKGRSSEVIPGSDRDTSNLNLVGVSTTDSIRNRSEGTIGGTGAGATRGEPRVVIQLEPALYQSLQSLLQGRNFLDDVLHDRASQNNRSKIIYSNFLEEILHGRTLQDNRSEIIHSDYLDDVLHGRTPPDINPPEIIHMKNGDTITSDGYNFSIVDRNGKPVTVVERTDHNNIPGNVEYRLSNGAIYHSGCWGDNLFYPDGTRVPFSTNRFAPIKLP